VGDDTETAEHDEEAAPLILKVLVPQSDPAFRSGYVATWHKNEGDPVAFGDHLCDIAIDEFMALQRTKRASLLGSTSRMKTRKLKDGYDRREGRGVVHVRLSSSETGVVLGKIVVPEGGRVDIGQMVAVLSDAPDSADIDEASIAAAAAARVAANMPDAGELDPFE
jgi:hypothetical protein